MKKVGSFRNNAKKSAPPRSVDEYLAGVPKEARTALEKVRKIIKSAVPDATEVISYRIPVFKYKGRPLVAFAAFKNHCSFYPMSTKVMRAHTEKLKGYQLSKGAIRFAANKPLPAELVKMIAEARVVENERARGE